MQENNDEENEQPEHVNLRIQLKDAHRNNKGTMRLRTNPKVIKTPNFGPDAVDEKLYSMMLMFFPFRDETTFSQLGSTWIAFEALRPRFRTNQQSEVIPLYFGEQIEQAILAMDVVENINEEENVKVNFQPDYDHLDIDDGVMEDENPVINSTFNFQEFRRRVESFIPEQKAVFDKVQSIQENYLQLKYLLVTGGG